MISKSEAIIASLLFAKNISYVYESPITGDKGVTIHSVFTVESELGITYYWEHLGMLSDDGYRSEWNIKKAWYARNDVKEFDKNSDADRQLN